MYATYCETYLDIGEGGPSGKLTAELPRYLTSPIRLWSMTVREDQFLRRPRSVEAGARIGRKVIW